MKALRAEPPNEPSNARPELFGCCVVEVPVLAVLLVPVTFPVFAVVPAVLPTFVVFVEAGSADEAVPTVELVSPAVWNGYCCAISH